MGLRSVSLETRAEIIFKEAKQILCEWGSGPSLPADISNFQQMGPRLPWNKGEVTAQHPVLRGLLRLALVLLLGRSGVEGLLL